MFRADVCGRGGQKKDESETVTSNPQADRMETQSFKDGNCRPSGLDDVGVV